MEKGDKVRHEKFGEGQIIKKHGHDLLFVSFKNKNIYATNTELKLIDTSTKTIPNYNREKENKIKRKKQEEAIQKEALQVKAEKLAEAKLIIQDWFNKDFLTMDKNYQKSQIRNHISNQDYTDIKTDLVSQWVKEHTETMLDKEQALACGTTGKNLQLIARAGSGKTRTLINRALFLIRHCKVAPKELLLLAFNKKAAKEMQERFIDLLGDNNLPHIMTFHALAYALVHPKENIIYDEPEGAQIKSRSIQQIIDNYLRTPEGLDKVRSLMMANFQEDWNAIIQGSYDKSPEEFLAYRRSIRTESLKGDYLKSYGEKVIADFLFEHNIPYKYERNFLWDGINYKPDFTISLSQNSGLIIEYFGFTGDPDYDEMSEAKRQFWKQKQEWLFLEFTPENFSYGGVPGFHKYLKECLEHYGIKPIRLTEQEIWSRIKHRAVDRFSRAMTSFVQRCRKMSLSPKELLNRIIKHTATNEIERQFIELGHKFYETYLEQLTEQGEEDFDGLLQRAIQQIQSGNTTFLRKAHGSGDLKLLRYILIDEYQDFSQLFMQMIHAVMDVNSSAEYFCVGDDWQAINGFAGSDLKYFKNFERYFSSTSKEPCCLNLSTNYRSAKQIVNTGNAVMSGLGKPALAARNDLGNVYKIDFGNFIPTDLEKESFDGDFITPIILRLVTKIIKQGKPVVLLGRRNGLGYYINFKKSTKAKGKTLDAFLEHLRSFLPKEDSHKVTISTTHQYKGLESHSVILLEVTGQAYPLIHPDWVFNQIFGDSLNKLIDDEQRLFYVAITRAADDLYILTDSDKPSPFLQEIPWSTIDWLSFPPPQPKESRLTARVMSMIGYGSIPTRSIKDLLKSEGYRFNNNWEGRPVWWKTIPDDKSSFLNLLKSSCWFTAADGVEVLIKNDLKKQTLAHYTRQNGELRCICDTQILESNNQQNSSP
ncbi:UvrD-helicase domain-containing protein [Endozoicomonas sp. ONNA1]|uniref:UvrD-helicase domain-containing protein n=1 Tax=Endozoicomonas sp. ONNA1 TaxID=2828740 RepID=UPI002148BB0D|nr:UvrD-helicase domain-containing protein [Endozoicomonas sp. ONNA1]